jgi:RHS repeat-associated protein
MTAIPIPTNLTSTYTGVYDAWNRLISLTSGSTTIATYAYDGLNRRVTKGVYVSGTLDHNEDAYFNESWQLLEVRKTVSGTINSNPLEQYVWHPVYIDAPVLRDYDATISGTPTRYYFAYDGNQNITAVTNSAGGAVERYYYSPYGTLTFLDASFAPIAGNQSSIANSVTYTGQRFDADTGLYCFRFRTYHSALGLFVQRDGSDHAPLNLYEYTHSMPTVSLDPSGLTRICIFTLMDGGADIPQGAWERDANSAEKYYSQGRNHATVFSGIASGAQLLKGIQDNGCCKILIVGHHGGARSKAALMTYPGQSQRDQGVGVPIFSKTDPWLSKQIGTTMQKNCASILGDTCCELRLFMCGGHFNKTDIQNFMTIADNTGCVVWVPTGNIEIGTFQTMVPGGGPTYQKSGLPFILDANYPKMSPFYPKSY